MMWGLLSRDKKLVFEFSLNREEPRGQSSFILRTLTNREEIRKLSRRVGNITGKAAQKTAQDMSPMSERLHRPTHQN